MEPQPLLTIGSGLLDFLRIVVAVAATGFLIPVLGATLLWIGFLVPTKNGHRTSQPAWST